MKHIKSLSFLVLFSYSLFSCKTNVVANHSVKEEVNYIPYYLKVYEADSLYQMRNYKGSYDILDSLFKKYKPLQMSNYNEYGIYIISCIMTGNIKDINEKVKKCYTDFGDLGIYHRDSDKLYDTLIKTTKITRDSVAIYTKEYGKKINLDLRKRIEIMLDEDQSVRMENYNEEGIKKFQEKHKLEIEEIISKYGYPDYQVIGHSGYKAPNGPIMFNTIFVHQDITVQEKYLPMMLENLKKGKCLPEEYASIFDKTIWVKTNKENNIKQFYGSFPNVPLVNSKKIDSIRKSIGLPSYGYQKWVDKLLHPHFYAK